MYRARFLLPALLLSGCTLIPKYQRPDAPVAAKFPGGSSPSGDAAEIRWRDFFTDPRLRRYIEIALENNRDLRVAVLNVEQARSQYRISRAGLFPRIDAGGSLTRARGAGDTTSSGGSSSSGDSATTTTTTSDTGATTVTTTSTPAVSTRNSGSTPMTSA